MIDNGTIAALGSYFLILLILCGAMVWLADLITEAME